MMHEHDLFDDDATMVYANMDEYKETDTNGTRYPYIHIPFRSPYNHRTRFHSLFPFLILFLLRLLLLLLCFLSLFLSLGLGNFMSFIIQAKTISCDLERV